MKAHVQRHRHTAGTAGGAALSPALPQLPEKQFVAKPAASCSTQRRVSRLWLGYCCHLMNQSLVALGAVTYVLTACPHHQTSWSQPLVLLRQGGSVGRQDRPFTYATGGTSWRACCFPGSMILDLCKNFPLFHDRAVWLPTHPPAEHPQASAGLGNQAKFFFENG